MALDLKIIEDDSTTEQEYKVWQLINDERCISVLAGEYRTLRTECAAPLSSVTVEGIGVVDTSRIQSILESKTIPSLGKGPFDIIKSDMGETLAYILLEHKYDTQIGYKNVRDRELINLPGRGIDIVGVENNGNLKLLLGEVKVSGEARNPPQVVDSNEDSISKSLRAHIENHKETSRKIWDVARRTRDPVIRNLLLAAATYWDEKMWSNLHVVCCGILVRPIDKYKNSDFGMLKDNPDFVAPASVRFLIVCIDCDLDDFIQKFYDLAITSGGAS